VTSISNKKWAIVLSSDLHFGSVHSSHGIDIRDDKRDHVQKIIDMKDEHNVEIVISAGDITDYGTNGICCFCSNNNNNSEDELTPLINNWVKPLENAGLDVLLTAGNHDTYTGHPYFHKPVLRYLKKKYNATYWPWFWMKYNGCYAYSKNNVLILSLGIYPKNLKFLKKNLPKDKKDPVIIFYHYNTVNEPYADWWKEDEKAAFYEVIKDYNIIAINNGHYHTTYEKEWRGFRIFNSAGTQLIRFNMNNNKIESVDFI
jgi:hypothetical protein